MPPGPPPTVAPDMNATVEWWTERITALAEQTVDAAQALRDNADAYEGVDQCVTDRFTSGQQTFAGNPRIAPGGMRTP